MRISQHSLISRGILLLLAAAMPLCCCVMPAVASSSSTPDAPIVASSCCSGPASCEQDESSSTPGCPSGCGTCCLKAPISPDHWTPPVDVIGAPILITTAWTETETMRSLVISGHLDRPPPDPWGDSAPPLRHATILQV